MKHKAVVFALLAAFFFTIFSSVAAQEATPTPEPTPTPEASPRLLSLR